MTYEEEQRACANAVRNAVARLNDALSKAHHQCVHVDLFLTPVADRCPAIIHLRRISQNL